MIVVLGSSSALDRLFASGNPDFPVRSTSPTPTRCGHLFLKFDASDVIEEEEIRMKYHKVSFYVVVSVQPKVSGTGNRGVLANLVRHHGFSSRGFARLP